MKGRPLTGEGGMTLLETVVALVLLAIVILYMAMIPLASKNSLMRSDMQNKANQAGKDKIELFRSLVTRWSAGPPRYSGWDSLVTNYATGRNDPYRNTNIIRNWDIARDNPVPGSARIFLRCVYTWRGRPDSTVYVTYAADRSRTH